MPERKFTGRCSDCGEESPDPQLLTWGQNLLSEDVGGDLVEWLKKHHFSKDRGECHMAFLLNDNGKNCGFVMVMRLTRFYQSHNLVDIRVQAISIE